jgi:acyl-homoserine lactone acylase PvdQ
MHKLFLAAALIAGSLVFAAPQDKLERTARDVTIYRDSYGVPHVFGPTDASVIFGFVFAQAEDNFWQIEDSYIQALGRASEIYGEKSLDADLTTAHLNRKDLGSRIFSSVRR